jgi:hypothetical protein
MDWMLWFGIFLYYLLGASSWMALLRNEDTFVTLLALTAGLVAPLLILALARKKMPLYLCRLTILGFGAGFCFGFFGLTPAWLHEKDPHIAFVVWLLVTLGLMVWIAPMMLDAKPDKESFS